MCVSMLGLDMDTDTDTNMEQVNPKRILPTQEHILILRDQKIQKNCALLKIKIMKRDQKISKMQMIECYVKYLGTTHFGY